MAATTLIPTRFITDLGGLASFPYALVTSALEGFLFIPTGSIYDLEVCRAILMVLFTHADY